MNLIILLSVVYVIAIALVVAAIKLITKMVSGDFEHKPSTKDEQKI